MGKSNTTNWTLWVPIQNEDGTYRVEEQDVDKNVLSTRDGFADRAAADAFIRDQILGDLFPS